MGWDGVGCEGMRGDELGSEMVEWSEMKSDAVCERPRS